MNKEIRIIPSKETETNLNKLKDFYQEKTSSKTIGIALKELLMIIESRKHTKNYKEILKYKKLKEKYW